MTKASRLQGWEYMWQAKLKIIHNKIGANFHCESILCM